MTQSVDLSAIQKKRRQDLAQALVELTTISDGRHATAKRVRRVRVDIECEPNVAVLEARLREIDPHHELLAITVPAVLAGVA
jgi:hypothetical protein